MMMGLTLVGNRAKQRYRAEQNGRCEERQRRPTLTQEIEQNRVGDILAPLLTLTQLIYRFWVGVCDLFEGSGGGSC